MLEKTTGFVDVAGGCLYYEQVGEGPDVVLLNAGLADLRMWETTVSWLAAEARVTTWDYRDSGLSSWSTEAYSEIDDLAAVLDAAEIAQANLVGTSDGARRALGFAHRYPERVTRVCAVGGSFGDFPDPTPEETAARAVMLTMFGELEGLLAKDDLAAAIALDVASWTPLLSDDDRRRRTGWEYSNSRVMTMDVYHGVELDPPVKTRFAEITTPVSVLVGERDFEGTQLWARRLVDQAPDATLRVLPDADHFPMLTAPDDFQKFLREALGLL